MYIPYYLMLLVKSPCISIFYESILIHFTLAVWSNIEEQLGSLVVPLLCKLLFTMFMGFVIESS
jgi:hypothetical protein